MRADPLAALSARNPVPELSPAGSSEAVWRRIEDDRVQGHPPRVRRAASRRSRARWSVLLAAVAVAAALVVITAASDGPIPDVPAKAYAAVAPAEGIVEAVFSEHFSAQKPSAVLRRHEWLDGATGRRRTQWNLLIKGKRRWTQEIAFSPGAVETWSGHAVAHMRLPRRPLGAVEQQDGLERYRRLYREGRVRLLGRRRYAGRLLYELASDIAWASPDGRRRIPLQRLVILVDPTSFLPVVERVYNLSRPGHPLMSESRLDSYRLLPRTAADEALLTLAARGRS